MSEATPRPRRSRVKYKRKAKVFDQATAALKRVILEVECYCADYTAAQGACVHCEARTVLQAMEGSR